jgi:hypothetical protein
MDVFKISLTDDELKELFALFSSPTEYELKQIYNKQEGNFYQSEDLSEEYVLTQEKREFSKDAWRAVTYFLYRKGFTLVREGIKYDLLASSGYDSEN